MSTSTTSGRPKRSQRSTNHAPFCEDSASRQPPRCLRLVGDDADRRARRCGRSRRPGCAPSAARARAARRRRSAARRRRARRRPRARARGGPRRGRPEPGRPAGRAAARRPPWTAGGPATARTSLGRVHVVGRRRGARRRCAPCTFGPPSSEAVTRSRVTASTTARAGEEHLRVGAGHDREVAERRRVRRAAGARAADHADLRHVGQRLRAEDRAVGVQRADALLQARAARVREADDRRRRACRPARSCGRSSRRRGRPASRP